MNHALVENVHANVQAPGAGEAFLQQNDIPHARYILLDLNVAPGDDPGGVDDLVLDMEEGPQTEAPP